MAGATGRLGGHVVRELMRRGHRVRALSRAPGRLEGVVDEVFRADLTDPASLRGACEGVDAVLSCAGASLRMDDFRDRRRYRDVDLAGNLNLLERAEAAGVGKFVYVSLFGGEELAHTGYAAAHEGVVRALAASGLPHTVVRPTGFFSFFEEILKMARKGRGPVLGSGEARTNPVHEADVAEACASAVELPEREVAVGGPEVYTRREIVEEAFRALGREPKLVHVPVWAFRGATALARPLNPRLHALLEFGVEVSRVDAVAPAYGTRTLGAHFREVAREWGAAPPQTSTGSAGASGTGSAGAGTATG